MSDVIFSDKDGTERLRGSLAGLTASAVGVERVVIPHADILTLPDTPVEILPAPAAGLALLPIAVWYVCDTTAGAYAGFGGDDELGLTTDNFGGYTIAAVLSETQGSQLSLLLASAAVVVAYAGFVQIVPANAGPTSSVAFTQGQPTSSYAAMPLSLSMTGTGSLEDGNVANSLAVTVIYATVSTAAA